MLDITCEMSAKQTVHMSIIISSEKYEKHALRMSSAICYWRLKG